MTFINSHCILDTLKLLTTFLHIQQSDTIRNGSELDCDTSMWKHCSVKAYNAEEEGRAVNDQKRQGACGNRTPDTRPAPLIQESKTLATFKTLKNFTR